ncbi:uncharacterized protein DUF4446 [Mobilisporobacter senegalensis]|uniref:Uncharacterized protein DUF4446 n=1 Tax=Mobilisporobacter senegalensis TaxID=1329262 RepID=A0A3N1X5V3_9FIRM|nr:DUF4446 family protein [Mobilisporobacter senegalensis]ROR22143.1 uncharacterized protein DUF4446 [Mobilisporobacter senegalensis]
MNYYLELIDLYSAYIIIGIMSFILLLLILLIISNVKYSKLNRKYKSFMQGTSGESIERIVLDKFEEINELKKETNIINTHLKKIDEILSITYQKSAIVKYDAFKEMGGKLSFALALLNEENNGFIINSMHSSREGCYTYIKEVIKGESFVQLAEEEKQALEEAKNSRKYM